jgi:hypothetical protein
MDEMKHNYEESMRDYCTTLTQHCAGIQATLQEELRRILADKTSVVQAAREEKVNLDAQIALLTARYILSPKCMLNSTFECRFATAETVAREMEIRYKGELDTLKVSKPYGRRGNTNLPLARARLAERKIGRSSNIFFT